MPNPNPAVDADWSHWTAEWQIRGDTTYLNHGSFGPPPRVVQQERERWQRKLDEQPMDFFVRQYESAWLNARQSLAEFIDSEPNDLVFVENATAAMNLVADSFPLAAGEEVLLTDHEYGAVFRIWQRKCDQVQGKLQTVELPWPVTSQAEIVAAVLNGITNKTRIVVLSHITSPTALILPVAEIAAECRKLNVAVCIDGPHAPLQVDVSLRNLGCDFYAASCHKWLSAPFGSGFLAVAPKWQSEFRCGQLSWGRLQPAKPQAWWEEFVWSGTRDAAPYFTLPTAIDFARRVGPDNFRQRSHHLAQQSRQLLEALFQQPVFLPDDPSFYGSMALVALPAGETFPLQRALWERFCIEVPIVPFRGGRFVRVSCHLYNTVNDLDKLQQALQQLVLREGM
jgi:isopenicillin-N epimerase